MNKPDDYGRWLALRRDLRAPDDFTDGVMREIAARETKKTARVAFSASPALERLCYFAFALVMSALGLYRLVGAAAAILVP